jgi:P4 family phage/plasmid primase-like protien
LTQKRSGVGSAQPELAATSGKRFASLQEPDGQERLNIGLMKELTGGDKITARSLFHDPFIFKPQFKLLLACNHKPYVPADDEGTWRRLRVVEFKSKFVKNPDPKKPNEFERDNHLDEKLDKWKEAFMSLLIHIFTIYKKEGLNEPEDVKECTREYQKDNDIYMEYIDENLIFNEDDKKNTVKINVLFQAFKSWFKINHEQKKAPTKRELQNYIEKKFGKYNKKFGWIGLRFRDEEDDIVPENAALDEKT